jgi:hypothetical protein
VVLAEVAPAWIDNRAVGRDRLGQRSRGGTSMANKDKKKSSAKSNKPKLTAKEKKQKKLAAKQGK